MKKLSRALLWNGFSYRWQRNPHRLSILGTRFEEVLFGKNSMTVWHRFRSKVGHWPLDSLDYQIPYTFLQAENVWMGTATARCQMCCFYKEKGEISFSAVIPLDAIRASLPFSEIKDAPKAKWLAFLNGFHIFSSNNKSGWHFKEFTLKIGEVSVGKNEISIPITARIHPSDNPEWVSHGNEKWIGKPHCAYNLEVDIFVLADPQKRVKAHKFSLNETVIGKGEHETKDAFQHKSKEPIQFFSAIRGFSIRDKDEESKGKYLRGLTVTTERYHEDHEQGLYISNGLVSFSNRGKWVFKSAMELSLETSIVTFPEEMMNLKSGVLQGKTVKGESEHEQAIKFNFD